jgi:hypothetical protein
MKRNALCISQWKAKRYEAVEDIKTCAETQTDDSIPITDECTQTEIHNDKRALHNPTTSTQVRERSTQTIRNFIGRQLTQTKYLIDPEDDRKPWKTCTTVRSPYIRDKLSYKTEYKDGSVSFSESFDPDDPTLIDRFPDYTTETDLGERPPTPTQRRGKKQHAKGKQEEENYVCNTSIGEPDVKPSYYYYYTPCGVKNAFIKWEEVGVVNKHRDHKITTKFLVCNSSFIIATMYV